MQITNNSMNYTMKTKALLLSLLLTMAMAAEGPPIPVDVIITFFPQSIPATDLNSRFSPINSGFSSFSAIKSTRAGSPGKIAYSALKQTGIFR